jgi:predicted metal-binding protein
MIRVTLCKTCPAGQEGLIEPLSKAIENIGFSVDASETECHSGCARPSTIGFRATGKTAYLFGDITAGDLPDILTFLRLYHQSPDGNFADTRPLGALRLKALARIPG